MYISPSYGRRGFMSPANPIYRVVRIRAGLHFSGYPPFEDVHELRKAED